MTVYIVDNGEEYSGHSLYFYDVPDDVPQADGVWLVENAPDRYQRYTVIGVTPSVEWFDGGTAPVCGAGDIDPVGHDTDPTWREWITRCPVSMLRTIVTAERRENDERIARVLNDHENDWYLRNLASCEDDRRRLERLDSWIDAGKPLPPMEEEGDD